MASPLQFPAIPVPRHGILLNPSPSTSPYSHGCSLPGTPRLISSLSSLSSSASSNSPNTSDVDAYFLTYASAKDTLSSSQAHDSPQANDSSLPRDNSKKSRPSSAQQTKRIRFAPLPEPRRDDLPEVFLNDSDENLLDAPSAYDSAPSSRASSRPSSLLLSGVVNLDQASSDSTPTLSTTNLNDHNHAHSHSHSHSHAVASSSSTPISSSETAPGADKGDNEWDMCQPTSPSTTISSLEQSSASCPASPASRRLDLPREKERSWSAKLFKPFRPRSSTATSRDSEDGLSSGTNTPARSCSRERSGSSEGDCGAPLERYASSESTTHKKAPRRGSFLTAALGGGSDDGLWRTQSGPGDCRRVKSREQEAEALRRVRSGSGSGQGAPRKQLRMLNGRVYGAKRAQNNVNLFASARSDPEFVEWGYGGMGSVKSAASVGADNRWSRVAGNSSFSGSSEERRGRAGADDDDFDGSGMAWVKRRKEQKEQREREKKEQEAKEREHAQEAAVEKHEAERPHADVADPDPPSKVKEAKEAQGEADKDETIVEKAGVEKQEHVTTVAVLAPRSPHMHNRPLTMERAPSIASVSASGHVQLVRAVPERRGSADTARAATPVSVHTLTEQSVGALEDDDGLSARERSRSESESSSGTSANTTEEEEEDEDEEDEGDADTEENPKDDEDEEEEDEMTRRTALGAGVEKISRHKEKPQSQSVPHVQAQQQQQQQQQRESEGSMTAALSN